MAKQVIGNLKLRIPAGRATAGPPVGSTLGQWGLNMMDFINPFNEATKGDMGKDVIVHIQVFEDRTFAWKSLGQPVDDMIREKIGKIFTPDIARKVRILYGGSVNEKNAASFNLSGIDGVLVGGASLKADTFAAIVRSF